MKNTTTTYCSDHSNRSGVVRNIVSPICILNSKFKIKEIFTISKFIKYNMTGLAKYDIGGSCIGRLELK
jgi:hypothetical protein